MSVNLIHITPEAEQLILYIARVSSDQSRTNPGLIRYLIRNNHWSPFMLVYACLEFKASRTISHQMIRHWTLACLESGDIPGVQEFSQRYAPAIGTVKYRARVAGSSNRQSSVDAAPHHVQQWFDKAQAEVEAFCFDRYRDAVDLGIATECARFLLPEATSTKFYLSGSIRSWIHYLHERTAESAQLEHRLLALEARDALAEHLPTVAAATGWVPDSPDEETEPVVEGRYYGYSGP